MTKLRIVLFIIFLVAVAVLIVFPYRSKAPVNIGFLGSLSGNGSAVDISACNGAILALDALNERGGIKGRRLKMNIYDFKGNPGRISRIFDLMKKKGTAFLVAPYIPDAQFREGSVKDQILTICAGFRRAIGDKKGLDIVLYPLVQDYGEMLADLALKRKITRMAAAVDAFYYPFGLALSEGFSTQYQEQGGIITTAITFDSRDKTDMTRMAEIVAADDPQGLLVIASGASTGRFSALVRRKLPEASLYAAPWALTQDLTGNAGDSLDGLCTYGTDAGKPRQSALESFYAAYERQYGKAADLSALFGYEAMMVLAEGIRNSASPDPSLVRHTLEKMGRFKGLVSDYTVSAGDSIKEALLLRELRGGVITQSQ